LKNRSTLFQKKIKNPASPEVTINDFLRNVLGIKPKNMELYKMALVHRSASSVNPVLGTLNNERLEYLGDAMLSAIVADFLFKKFPLHPEGPLTEMRSKLVCRDRLNSLSRKIGLNVLINQEYGNGAKSVDGDAFEALIGAIYLDKGFEKTKQILIKKILLTHLDLDAVIYEDNNYKGKLLNWGQKNNKLIKFENQLIFDESNKKMHKSIVLIDGMQSGDGLDFTIKKAEQTASAKALESLSDIDHER
jgi:ribonuclease-3